MFKDGTDVITTPLHDAIPAARALPLTRRSALLLAGASALVAVSAPALAQIALYADALPPGFAYVRFANTTAEAVTLSPNFGDKLTMGTDGQARLTPYQVVEKVAERTLSAEFASGAVKGSATLPLTPGSFHTVLVSRKGTGFETKIIVDTTEYNQLRARLAFYNATADCANAALLLEPKNQAIFTGVAPGSMKARSVNPVESAKVQATCGTAKPPVVDMGELGPGGLYSMWLMAPSGTPVAFMARDTIAPYQR